MIQEAIFFSKMAGLQKSKIPHASDGLATEPPKLKTIVNDPTEAQVNYALNFSFS